MPWGFQIKFLLQTFCPSIKPWEFSEALSITAPEHWHIMVIIKPSPPSKGKERTDSGTSKLMNCCNYSDHTDVGVYWHWLMATHQFALRWKEVQGYQGLVHRQEIRFLFQSNVDKRKVSVHLSACRFFIFPIMFSSHFHMHRFSRTSPRWRGAAAHSQFSFY